VSRLGGLDVLVNNAGAGVFGPVEACSEDDYRRMMEINYFGPVRLLRAALPHLRASRGAAVNVASMAGMLAMPGTSAYSTAKHAIVGLSEALAEELAPLGVKVILVLPGGFRTNFWDARTTTIRDDFEGLYAPYMAGQIRKLSAAHVGNEPGDPAKLPAALFAALDAPEAPVHLVLGADALKQVAAQLERTRADLEKCRDLTVSTAFDRATRATDSIRRQGIPWRNRHWNSIAPRNRIRFPRRARACASGPGVQAMPRGLPRAVCWHICCRDIPNIPPPGCFRSGRRNCNSCGNARSCAPSLHRGRIGSQRTPPRR
jgi:hypothetical protein